MLNRTHSKKVLFPSTIILVTQLVVNNLNRNNNAIKSFLHYSRDDVCRANSKSQNMWDKGAKKVKRNKCLSKTVNLTEMRLYGKNRMELQNT